MNIIKTPFEGLLIIEPKVHEDERGYFMESYNKHTFETTGGITTEFRQDNQAKSGINVLRGLHYQNQPTPQAKLIRVLTGTIWDVVVDIRKDSDTYKRWYGIELSAENRRQFLIPHGFAHGYAVLSETAEVFYKCDNFYNKAAEGGIYFNDPELAIDWKIDISKAIISEKDQNQPMFKDAVSSY
ncbi:MAG: dTDP-4-dehydrorhamnose 3,5-epimerase [Bacteroidota bacterium]